MNTTQETSKTQAITQKLHMVVSALQLTTCAYVFWVLWLILAPVRDSASLIEWLSSAWHRSLTGLQPWQLNTYFLIDLVNWALIALAAINCSQGMQQIKLAHGQDSFASRKIIIGAWLIVAAEGYSLLARPIKSYILTCCDSTDSPIIHWFFTPQDILVTILCLTLLGTAYIVCWKSYLTEEAKGFI